MESSAQSLYTQSGSTPSTAPIPLFERLLIESQSNCNRTCWFCPRTYERHGKYFHTTGRPVSNRMPTDKILDLLDQAAALGFRGLVTFYHYSEPLLDKRNTMLAREAGKRGMKPYLCTNGDVLKGDDALCAEVVEVYRRIVVGLYDYRTDEELAEAKRSWQRRLCGAHLEFSAIGLSGARGARSMGVPRAEVPSDERFGVPNLAFANAPCLRPLIRMIIQHDGTVANCCEDTHGTFDLGNAHRNSLGELWYSTRHNEIAADLRQGHRQKYRLCERCPQSPTGPAPDGTRIGIAPRREQFHGDPSE